MAVFVHKESHRQQLESWTRTLKVENCCGQRIHLFFIVLQKYMSYCAKLNAFLYQLVFLHTLCLLDICCHMANLFLHLLLFLCICSVFKPLCCENEKVLVSVCSCFFKLCAGLSWLLHSSYNNVLFLFILSLSFVHSSHSYPSKRLLVRKTCLDLIYKLMEIQKRSCFCKVHQEIVFKRSPSGL